MLEKIKRETPSDFREEIPVEGPLKACLDSETKHRLESLLLETSQDKSYLICQWIQTNFMERSLVLPRTQSA